MRKLLALAFMSLLWAAPAVAQVSSQAAKPEPFMHFYLNWTKERLDEMDAALTSLEAKLSQVRTDSKVKANQLIADLKKRRDEFQVTVKKHSEAGEAAWDSSRTQLESQWNGFDAQLKTYIEAVSKQQHAIFQDVAAAQEKAWREAVDKLRDAAGNVPIAGRADIDTAVKRMRSDASEVEARLQRLKQAKNESWTALSAALADSRKAFDRANQAAWDALKRATASKT